MQKLKIKIKAKIFIVFLLFSSLELIFPWKLIQGTRYAVGNIQRGKWAIYDYSYRFYWKNETSGESREEIESGTCNITVLSINGTEVTLSITTIPTDGNVTQEIRIGDVKTGEGNLTFYLIAGDLSKGDRIPTSDPAKFLILNKTYTARYAGANREVNLLEYQNIHEGELGETFGNETFHVVWDKETGFLCELKAIHLWMVRNEGRTEMEMHLCIVKTNLWEPQTDLSSFTVFLTIIIILIVAVVVWKKWKDKVARRRYRAKR